MEFVASVLALIFIVFGHHHFLLVPFQEVSLADWGRHDYLRRIGRRHIARLKFQPSLLLARLEVAERPISACRMCCNCCNSNFALATVLLVVVGVDRDIVAASPLLWTVARIKAGRY